MRIINAGNIVMNSYVYPFSDGYVMIDTGYEGMWCFVAMQR